uniref:SAC3/GANP/THP3 conserved domain-containing protein n=1 Tax=Magallana gigas TaxID=29159 RepID=A0A8W8NYK8_MAGGI
MERLAPNSTGKCIQMCPAKEKEMRIRENLIHPLEKVYRSERVDQNNDRPWAEVYDFIFDRLRAVRQDMTIQQSDGPVAITLLEYALGF